MSPELRKMAEEAGIDFLSGWNEDFKPSEYCECWPEQLEAFVAAVIKNERERKE